MIRAEKRKACERKRACGIQRSYVSTLLLPFGLSIFGKYGLLTFRSFLLPSLHSSAPHTGTSYVFLFSQQCRHEIYGACQTTVLFANTPRHRSALAAPDLKTFRFRTRQLAPPSTSSCIGLSLPTSATSSLTMHQSTLCFAIYKGFHRSWDHHLRSFILFSTAPHPSIREVIREPKFKQATSTTSPGVFLRWPMRCLEPHDMAPIARAAL